MRKADKVFNRVLISVLAIMVVCLVWAAFTVSESARVGLILVAFGLVSIISLIIAFTAVWGAQRALERAEDAYRASQSALWHGEHVERLYADMTAYKPVKNTSF